MAFANYLGAHVSFYNIEQKEQILAFLDTKKKSVEQDPDQRWITTWNHNLTRIKQFFRWVVNSYVVLMLNYDRPFNFLGWA